MSVTFDISAVRRSSHATYYSLQICTPLLKEFFVQVVKNIAVEMFIERFIYVFRHVITVSKHAYPILTEQNGHGIITSLPAG